MLNDYGVSFIIKTGIWLISLDCLNTLIVMKCDRKCRSRTADVLDQEHLHAIIEQVEELFRTTCHSHTRNSSGDEIANVNFLYDDIVHALKMQYSCINSATDRFLQRRFTKFSEITQCNGH